MVRSGQQNSILFAMVMLLMTIVNIFGQSNYWPDQFSFPEATAKDSSKTDPVTITSSVIVNDIFKSKNVLSYNKANGSYLLQQQLEYQIADFLNGVYNQYFDLSGKYMRQGLFKDHIDLGLDWTPGLYYNRSKIDGTLQVPVDIGPVLAFRVASVPVKIRTGLAAFGWNNDFTKNSGMLAGNYHGDPGYYGGISIGDTLLRWFKLPFVANVNALGKSIGGTSLGVIKSALKTAFEYRTGDSVYFLLGDSLSNGKELYAAGSNSNLYSGYPWKVGHSFSFTGALRGKERFLLRPAVIYSYGVRSTNYPSQPELLDNFKAVKNSLIFQLATGEKKVLTYSGGLSVSWEDGDWMYNETKDNIENDSSKKKQATNLGDYKQYNALSDHDLLLRLPHGFAINYQLHALRDSKRYPYSYVRQGEKVVNENEGDHVHIVHHGGLLHEIKDRTFMEFYGESIKDYLYYYRKARSGDSEIRDEYKIGFNTEMAFGSLQIGENVFAEAEKSDYKFKEIHKGALFDPPEYSRKISSLMIAQWFINKQWVITGKWNETYYDNGKWYGKAYSDTIVKIGKEFYAIENKSNDYSLQILTSYMMKNNQWECGILFRDSYLRVYDNENGYKAEESEIGYVIEPSLKYECLFSNFLLSTKVIRKINTYDKNKWEFSRNWDISLNMKAVF